MSEREVSARSLLGEPLILPTDSAEQPLLPNWQRWLSGFLVLGVVARCIRYCLCFPLWEDECFLCVSVFKRGFRELLAPLDYHQVAPGLFLWLEKAITLLFGFNESALRLIPFLCGIASLFLFNHLVSRVLRGSIRVFCVALFAVSYPGIRYSAEAKPYGMDLFVSLVLIVLLVEWLRAPAQRKWLLGLTVWCPLAIGLSYPAVFTAGGVSLILFVMMLRHRLPGAWKWWVLYNATLGGAALTVLLLVVRPQMKAELNFMSGYWSVVGFPPRNSLFAFLKWFILTHTGAFFAHPAGDNNGGSTVTAILGTLGMLFFFKGRRRLVPALLLAPLSLHFIAALLHRYPYGGPVKFSMYFAPMVYLLMGAGCGALLGAQARKHPARRVARHAVIMLAVIGCIALITIGMDLAHPYKTTSDMRARAFARWFWYTGGFEDQAVDIREDLHREFSQATWQDLSWSAMYLANMYIYRPDHYVTEPRPDWAPRRPERILRCVLFRDGTKPVDAQALDQWLTEMKGTYPYLGHEIYPFTRLDKGERRLIHIDYVEVYNFQLPGTETTQAYGAEEEGSAAGPGRSMSSTSTQ